MPEINGIELIDLSSDDENSDDEDVIILSSPPRSPPLPPSTDSNPSKRRKRRSELELLTDSIGPIVVNEDNCSRTRNKGVVKLEARDREEKDDECVVLEFDPYEVKKEMHEGGEGTGGDRDGEDDVCVVGERGQVACRDYPHSRHLCVKFPFKDTSHQSYCKQCYCFVCDSIAPCQFWLGNPIGLGHCHATKEDSYWTFLRKVREQTPELLKQLHTRTYT